jgi:hypothetical protein
VEQFTSITLHRPNADAGDEVIGHITHGEHCENRNCHKQQRVGRRYHATPTGFCVIVEPTHYHTVDEAVRAIEDAMRGIPGRNPALTVEQDENWTEGVYLADHERSS